MQKFTDKFTTAKGETRAWVELNKLKTLWFNTGTRCNLSCGNCYIESSPTNDRLSYISAKEVQSYFSEETFHEVELVGFTGGEPFLNPEIIEILEATLNTQKEVLVLTNAYRVLKRHWSQLLELKDTYKNKLSIRVSLDHFSKEIHEQERGENTFKPTLRTIKELVDSGFNVSIAGRALAQDSIEQVRESYQELLSANEISIDMGKKLVVFPEMIAGEDVPEITTECWGILNKTPEMQMCSSERMIVKRNGDDSPVVLACTLLAYDKEFELGKKLDTAQKKVYLNHEFCAKFCVLGGSSCSSTY